MVSLSNWGLDKQQVTAMESVSHVTTLLGGVFGVLLLVSVYLKRLYELRGLTFVSAFSLQPVD